MSSASNDNGGEVSSMDSFHLDLGDVDNEQLDSQYQDGGINRSVVSYRRLSQCKEEDEEEIVPNIIGQDSERWCSTRKKPEDSFETPVISGGEKSNSETSSSSSKSSVIGTITGPTHKFVITKTKNYPSSEENSTESSTTSEFKHDIGISNRQEPQQEVLVSDGYYFRPQSEIAKQLFASRKKYFQSNTVHFPTSETRTRPSVYSIFDGEEPLAKSALERPHYDSQFFDSSLIEMRNSAGILNASLNKNKDDENSSGAVHDVWVRRPCADNKDFYRNLLQNSNPGCTTDENKSNNLQRPRSGTWNSNETQAMVAEVSKAKSKDKEEKRIKKEKSCRSGPTSRSNSAERKKSSGMSSAEDVQSPKKSGMLDAFRSRSNSDASKKKSSALMATMKSAMLHTGLIHSSMNSHKQKAPRDGSAHPVRDPGTSHTQYYHTVTAAASNTGSGGRSPMTKVMDIFRNRSTHSSVPAEDRKRGGRSQLVQGVHLKQKSLDPDRRRQSLGTILPHRASDAFVDPHHAAILFRDSRGLPVVDPFLEKIKLSPSGWWPCAYYGNWRTWLKIDRKMDVCKANPCG